MENILDKMKELLIKHGFVTEPEVEFNSFKLSDDTLIQVEGEIEVEKEIFTINEESGEREVLTNGEYKTDTLKFNVEDGKVSEVAERFAEVTTVDGVVLMIEGEVAEGSAVMVVLEEGNEPAPDGNYELEDGTKFQVAEGVIVKVGEEEAPEEPEVPEEEVPEEPKADEMSELFDMLKSFIENVSTKMEEMETKVDNFQSSVDELKNNFESFKKEPAGNPINNKKTEMGSEDESLVERIRRRNKNK